MTSSSSFPSSSATTTNTPYSPFDCLVTAEQTQSGLLQKEPTEVDVLIIDPIELRSLNTEPMVPLNEQHQVDVAKTNQPWTDRISGLAMQLTTHRIVFWQSTTTTTTTHRSCRYLHHSQLLQFNTESGHYFKSPKIVLNTAALGDLCLVFSKDKNKKRDDYFAAALQKVLLRRGWEERTTTTSTAAAPRRRVGLDAILTTSALRHQQAAQLAETAFQGDAETLLREAQELVQVIQQYVATLERQQNQNDNSNNKDTQQLMGMLQNMGMTSALSKANFQGRSYPALLARELGDFLRPKLTPTNPVMTLTDVYCLFNRARGSNLLSPEDFRAAAEECKRLQLGISVVTLPSGLVVLQDDQQADPACLQERLQLLLSQQLDNNATSLTALDVSRHWRISAVLALEQLKVVEQCGYWVRDETLESLRFYPNRFGEFKY